MATKKAKPVKKASPPKKRKGSIVVWKSKKDGKFYFHLESSNGKIVIQNTQGYERRVHLVHTLYAMVAIFREGRFVIKETK